METFEGKNIKIGKSILSIPDYEEIKVHGKRPLIQYGWAETENHYFMRPYYVHLEDIKKFDLFPPIRKYVLQSINSQTKARRTLGGGLIIKKDRSYKDTQSTAKFSRKQYNEIRKYF